MEYVLGYAIIGAIWATLVEIIDSNTPPLRNDPIRWLMSKQTHLLIMVVLWPLWVLIALAAYLYTVIGIISGRF